MPGGNRRRDGSGSNQSMSRSLVVGSRVSTSFANWCRNRTATMQRDESATPRQRIGLLAYDDTQPLDLTGPLDVFGAAIALASRMPSYSLHVIGVHTGTVRAENGLVGVRAAGGRRCVLDALRRKFGCHAVGFLWRRRLSRGGPREAAIGQLD